VPVCVVCDSAKNVDYVYAAALAAVGEAKWKCRSCKGTSESRTDSDVVCELLAEELQILYSLVVQVARTL
jgi:hypothetical protein